MLRWKNTGLKDLDTKKVLKNSGAYTTLLVAVLAMSFFGVCDQNGGMRAPSGSAAKVGGEIVTGNEFRRAYRMSYQRLASQFKDGFDPASFQLAHGVMRQLVDERIMYGEALKAGVRVGDDEITRLLAEADVFKDEKGVFSPEAFKNYLRANQYSEASLQEDLRRSLTVQRFRELVASSRLVSDAAAVQGYRLDGTKLNVEYLKLSPTDIKVEVSESDIAKFTDSDDGKKKIKNYYDTYAGEFNVEAQVSARHILIGFEGARNASSESSKRKKDVARKRAEEVLRKVKAGGADFAKLAQEYTDEAAGKGKGGDLGFFSRGMMVKEFSDAAFALKAGQVSEIVESPFGFHVIRVDAVKPARNESLEQASAGIARKLLAEEGKPVMLKARTDRLAAATSSDAEIEKVRRELGLSWKATGEFNLTTRVIPEIGSGAATLRAVAELKTPGQTSKSLVENRGSYYLIRLKQRTEADMSKLSPDKKEELVRSDAGAVGYAYLANLQKTVHDKLNKQGRIWQNPAYLETDNRNVANADGGESNGG